MIKVAILGAAGRMGRRLITLAHESEDFTIVAAVEAPGNAQLTKDAGVLAGIGEIGVPLTDTLDTIADTPEVLIDFTVPAGTLHWLDVCHRRRIAMVIGTTGLTPKQHEQLQQAAGKIPILWSANMSLGVNLLFRLAAEVAGRLPRHYDVEIVEAHHRFKRDAPSGTAMELARQVARARQWPWPDCLEHGRAGAEATRRPETIGMHALRGGDIIGEHTVLFTTLGETVELRHRAHSRDTFARGALQAARFLAGRKPGFYTMSDVLEL